MSKLCEFCRNNNPPSSSSSRFAADASVVAVAAVTADSDVDAVDDFCPVDIIEKDLMLNVNGVENNGE